MIVFRAFILFSVCIATIIQFDGEDVKKIKPAHSLTISEKFVDPMGFYDSLPSFSWKLPVSDEVLSQSAYSIVVASEPSLLPNHPDIWQSGKIQSGQSVFVPYEGTALSSRERVYWQVQFWNQENNESEWSETAHLELGLLKNEDWKGEWIGITTETPKLQTRYKTPLFVPQYLRKNFSTKKDIKKARLYITAKGLFEPFINGKKIGEDFMVPGWTPYSKRIETLTYDVTKNLVDGNNAIGIILAEGWYAGRIGYKATQWTNTVPPMMLCQLEIEYGDGSKDVIVSNNTWKATQNGPLRSSGIYDGEFYDASLEMHDWSCPGFEEERHWQAVITEEIAEQPLLRPKRHLPVRAIATKPSINVTRAQSNSAIFDIGQNLAGVARVSVPMAKGDTLVIKFAEMLNSDGSLHTTNYRSAHSTDYYIAKETGIIDWRPQFTYHGFRFVQLSGFAIGKKPKKSWVSAIVQHSKFDMIGSFSSSSAMLNQLQSNIKWGLKSNFYEIPTDCPQRNERLGFTGDAQVFTRAAVQNAALQGFFMAWMQSMREEQYDDNIIPVVIPNVIGKYSESGWSDAAVIIPWQVYKSTGNRAILEENYDMIKRWVAYHKSSSTDYISEMKSVGDWLQPYSTAVDARRGDTPHPLISTAYFGHAAKLTAKIAAILGKESESDYYEDLYKEVSNAFETKFFDNNGKLVVGTESQTGYLLALAYDLLSDELKIKAVDHLKRLIDEAGGHLRTGFLGTPLLAPVLVKTGNTDLMFELLFRETYPSWFYSINQGATTMWERWNSYSLESGFKDDSMNSLNHYAYGAVGQFFYEGISGITPLKAGYKKIRIAPQIGGGLTSAKGEIESPYGKIVSSWKLENGRCEFNVVIPPNTVATIELPVGKPSKILLNGRVYNNSPNIELVNSEDDKQVYMAKAGSYTFQTEL
ncbi:MAG: glycoside hydrolase family 78 protein [Leeuwenhoekiella sp.]